MTIRIPGATALLCASLGASLLAPTPAPAQEPASPSVRPDAQPEIKSGITGIRYSAVRAAEPPKIDGALDEALWSTATAFELAYETRPATNGPAPARTLGWIAYDDRALYFAFRVDDPEPAKVRARYTDRDRASQDDFVGLVLDTFHDGNRAFEFFVNPLGVQMDLTQNEITGEEDDRWDALWDSAGRLTATGWEVEAAIPLSSLRYPSTHGAQEWGFDAVRNWPRSSRYRLALAPQDRGRNCTLCQIATLDGIRGLEPRLDLELDPTLTASRSDVRSDFPEGRIEKGDEETEAGLSARWGITPNLTLNATLNPDFSQIEADAQQLDINTQFALFYPEKRPFFLEGADLFETKLDLVHTRDIADPSWGLKLTGKVGRNALGVLVADDEVTNLLLPGAEGSEIASLDAGNRSTILRYRRDLPLAGSTLGVIYTGRDGGDYQNHVLGTDMLFRFKGHHGLRIEAVGSETEYPAELAAELGQPVGRFSDHGLRLGYSYTSERWFAYSSYLDLGRDFRADLGFIPQVDIKQGAVGLERIVRSDQTNGKVWYDEMRFGSDYDETYDQKGNALEKELELWWNYEGKLQSNFHLRPGIRERWYQGVEFDQKYLFFFGEIRPASWFTTYVETSIGDGIDFVNVRPGDTLQLDPGLRFDLGRHWRINLDHSFERLDVDAGRLFTANLSRLSVIYQHNRRTQVRLISQYLDLDRDPTLYLETVEARTRRLSNQLLLSWKLNPQTVVFAGYSDQSMGDASIDLTRESRTFFVKLGYAWVR